jgi:hypothetical protein
MRWILAILFILISVFLLLTIIEAFNQQKLKEKIEQLSALKCICGVSQAA